MKGTERQTNGTDGLANSASAGNGVDAAHGAAAIDQVRDLLFGGAQRSIESNLAGLRAEMQASLKQLQSDFAGELAALQAKVVELEHDTEQKRLASLKDIGGVITQLGVVISGLGSGRTGE
ncbi:hypothetical protein JQ615_03270 [Bradyrhizobium jicamae]|uniref:DUF4164 domain-containing protein n=1 Tax=Bradyrhizobium jicamae TaxID=280332 RepID=A0ABS5FC84_9BRAD|nr:hypothetical protein [Bradyrhizobium jicamae]MBR0794403.1 hypothetical protein [Bradyrhizobium jicamae]MBR0933553.1 hypothetical protein [Bradyrhizobium jicamae]